MSRRGVVVSSMALMLALLAAPAVAVQVWTFDCAEDQWPNGNSITTGWVDNGGGKLLIYPEGNDPHVFCTGLQPQTVADTAWVLVSVTSTTVPDGQGLDIYMFSDGGHAQFPSDTATQGAKVYAFDLSAPGGDNGGYLNGTDITNFRLDFTAGPGEAGWEIEVDWIYMGSDPNFTPAEQDTTICIGDPIPGQVTVGTVSTGFNEAAANSFTLSHTLEAGENRMVVALIGREDQDNANDMPITGVTYGGQAMTVVTGAHGEVGTSFLAHTDIAYLLEANLPADGAHDLVVNLTGENNNIEAAAVTLSNVRQQAPEASANGSQPNADTPITTSITTVSNNALVLDIVISGAGADGSGDITATVAGMNRIFSLEAPSSHIAGATKLVPTPGSTDMGWEKANVSNRFAHSLVAIAPIPEEEPVPDAIAFTFDCDVEGFAGNGAVAVSHVIDGNNGLLSVDLNGNGDPFFSIGQAVNGTALPIVNALIIVEGLPGGNDPLGCAVFGFSASGICRAPFTLTEGENLVQVDMSTAAVITAAGAWDADVTSFRFDIPEAGEAALVGAGTTILVDTILIDEAANDLTTITTVDVDCDNDGLSNAQEEALGTDPANSDTDGDGVSDGTEVRFGSDPLDDQDTVDVPLTGHLGLALTLAALALAAVVLLRRRCIGA